MLAERIRSLEEGPGGSRTEDGSARLSEHPSLLPTTGLAAPAGDTTAVASATASRTHSSSGQQSVSSREARAGLLPTLAPQSGASGDSSDSNARAVDRAVKLVNRMLSGGKV